MSLFRRLAGAILVPRPAPPAPMGGLPFDALYPSAPAPMGARTAVPGRNGVVRALTSSQLLAPSNVGRTMLTIYNDSSAVLYLAHGPVATSAMFTVALAAAGTYIIETPDPYLGDVAGAWATATGQAAITETTDGQ